MDAHARLSGFSSAAFADAEDYDLELAAWARKPDNAVSENIEDGVLPLKTPASDVYAFACVCLEVRYHDKLSMPIPILCFIALCWPKRCSQQFG
jgi:hypothetical protein